VNIILVSDHLAKGRTISLSASQIRWGIAALIATPLFMGIIFTYFMLFHLGDIHIPYLQKLILSSQREEATKNRAYLHDSLSAMAVKLGQMEAQVVRLEALGERLIKLGGIPKQEFQFDKLPAQGGPESSVPARDMSFVELGKQLDQLSKRLDDRTDQLGVMESLMLKQRVKAYSTPSRLPVKIGWYSSNYGWRIDPFTGQNAFHEGVDFMAEIGTPILAAAGGIVVCSEKSTSYGNMVEIDHGNGLSSRYAHMSKRLVKVGDVVLRGQEIGEVGSTGRSTGPHLHFEVLLNGKPQNPAKYLSQKG
jgi:murein DD-endopeptidase MepM/ murein hydrolase activator NlpD